MARRRHFAVERLSKEGVAICLRGFENNWSLEHTTDVLQKTTGEELATSSLHRWWSAETVKRDLFRRQQGADAMLSMVSSDPDGRFARAISMMLQQQLLQREQELAQGNASELLKLHVEMERLANQTKRTEIAARAVDVEDRKAGAAEMQAEAAHRLAVARVKVLEAQISKAAEKLEQAEKQVAGGRSLSAEELRTIREEVFGFVSPPEPEVAHG